MGNAPVGSMSEWSGVLKDCLRQIDDGSMSLDALKGFVAHRQIRRFRLGDTQEIAYKEQRDKWGERWKKDFSGLFIPEHQESFDRLLIIPQGMTPNKAFDRLLAANIPAWRYTDNLNSIFSVRPACSDYAIWVRNREEADEEWQGKSANDVLVALVNGINLPERLVFEEDYFRETGSHLDVQSITLCAGSRNSDGNVPRVHWDDGEVRVGWYRAGNAFGFVRVREVVS